MDPGPPTQLRAQNAKWKNDNKVLREVRRGRKMGTNCVAGSAEDAKWVQIVPSEDPEYYLFITDFGRNYLNEDSTQKLFVLHEDPMQN